MLRLSERFLIEAGRVQYNKSMSWEQKALDLVGKENVRKTEFTEEGVKSALFEFTDGSECIIHYGEFQDLDINSFPRFTWE